MSAFTPNPDDPVPSRRVFLLATCCLMAGLAAPTLAAAESGLISAEAAHDAVVGGQAAMIDVRSPQEWKQTGIAKGALPITIHGPNGLNGFVAAVVAEFGEDPSRPIVLVCARGNRSTAAQRALQSKGFTNVLNLREGMLGSRDGPGWLARKLPLQSIP